MWYIYDTYVHNKHNLTYFQNGSTRSTRRWRATLCPWRRWSWWPFIHDQPHPDGHDGPQHQDDHDDHLFKIGLILMVIMILNIKTGSVRNLPDKWQFWKSSPRPDQDEIFAILKVMTTRWSSRYTWWSRYSEIPTRVGSSKNIYSELSVAVHSVQTRLV